MLFVSYRLFKETDFKSHSDKDLGEMLPVFIKEAQQRNYRSAGVCHKTGVLPNISVSALSKITDWLG